MRYTRLRIEMMFLGPQKAFSEGRSGFDEMEIQSLWG